MAQLTTEEFLDRFPEFQTGSPIVGLKLAEAHRMFDEALFGDLYLDAVGYKAAELLAFSPYGKNSRLSDKTTETTYRKALEDILSRIPASPFCIR
jgi:hypothetical protein